MGWFGNKGKKEVLDLSKMYKKQSEKTPTNAVSRNIKPSSSQSQSSLSSSSKSQSPSAFNFFGNPAFSSSSQTSQTSSDESSENYSENYGENSDEEKKRKFAKRLVDMTKKSEELSNQIYHLQQRLEVLEKKFAAGSY